MRIIRTFLLTLLVLGAVAGLGFLILREGLLLLAQSQVKAVASRLNGIAKSTQYRQQCYDLLGSDIVFENTVDQVQLRFLDDTTYVLEAICQLRPHEPIEIEQFSLPQFVTKVPGSSGIVVSDAQSGFTIELWGRRAAIAFAGTKVVPAQPGTTFALTPAAECQGYGYQCCSPEVGMGQGELLSPVLDCPTQCYTSCQLRPAVLSFVSDPYPDQINRTVELNKGEEITFFYVFESRQDGTITGTIDFGDGQSEQLTGTQGQVSHTYPCTRAQCTFTATMTVTNTTTQISSVVSPLSSLIITIK